MSPPGRKRYPLPRRFNAALSDAAYTRLRLLNQKYGLGNNYLLTVLLENLDQIADPGQLSRAFDTFIENYGAPQPKGGTRPE